MLRFTLCVMLALAAVPVAVNGQVAAQVEVGRVRFVNTTSTGLDAYIDGTLWVAGLTASSNYSDVNTGEHVFSFRAAGSAEDMAETAYAIKSGQRLTIAAIDAPDSLAALAVVDDVQAPARNCARVKLVHAAVGVGAISATLGDTALAEGLEYGAVGTPIQVPDGGHALSVTLDGAALVSEAARAFTGNRAYTLFLVGTPDALRIVTSDSSVLTPTAASQFRFAHMVPDVGSVAVYVNNESVPLYPEVPFSRVTQYLVTGQGPHTFEVYPVGSGPANGKPLATGQAEIAESESALFVTQGTADAMEIGVYKGDIGPVAPNSSRLQVINLARGNPAIQVRDTQSGALLFEDVDYLESSVRSVPGGAYGIRFEDADSGDLMMDRPGVRIPPGSLTFLIAFDNDPQIDLVNAVTVSTENVLQYAQVRWAQLDVWGPAVDVYLDDVLVAEDLEFQDATTYTLLLPGRYAIAVYSAGTDPDSGAALVVDEVALTATDSARTVFVYGTPDAMKIDLEPDSLALLPPDRARVRFVNAAVDTFEVDVVNLATGKAWVEGLYFDQSSVNINIEPGSYTFDFRLNETSLARAADVVLRPGQTYTVVLTGQADNELAVAVLQAAP